ncbi:MAG: amidohydrolase [Hyphomicrobiales bacterium]|nr:MAG: amidohydrolase [Hyphomicrobiales bacterium]
MPKPLPGAIDCDVHPSVPGMKSLMPHLSDHWAEVIDQSGLPDLETWNYPPGAPLTARSDWRPQARKPAANVEAMRVETLDRWGTGIAICNALYGVQTLFNEDLAAGLCRGLNTWLAREWLDRDPRLRGSIVLPVQSVERSVDEIEHWANDKRFVQVLMLVGGETPLGRRHNWPIYAAAARHGLPVGIHAGSSFRHPTTPVGWTSYYTEDYVNQSLAFQTQLASLICEGVFSKYPDLRVVLIESGVSWLPAHIWHLDKFWKGLRMEVPWVDRPPFEIVRDHVRLTAQPLDGPATPVAFGQFMEQMGSDKLLLFASDYPHWQFDGDDAVPDVISPTLARKMQFDNPRETYRRLEETKS